MKLFKQEPINFIRVRIWQQGEKSKYFSLIECTLEEVVENFKSIIEKQNLSIFSEGVKTMINVRKAIGGKNLGSKNISFKGLTVEETYNVIIKELKK